MNEHADDRISPSGVRRVLQAFLPLNQVGSAGSVCVFLALGEGGGDLDVNALAGASGMPVVSVCRFAESLAKDDPRPGRRTKALVSRSQAAPGKLPSYALTPEGRALYDELFPPEPTDLARAA